MTTAAPPAPSQNGAGPTTPSIADDVKILHAALAWAKAENAESDHVLTLMLLNALSKTHGFMAGEASTGKSRLVRTMREILPGPWFLTQLKKDQDTQAIFGPISLKGIEQDDFRHSTAGYLAEARFAFLDEFNDASTLIRRGLLMTMYEREFPNGSTVLPVPLVTVWGATNFWTDEPELEALMSRFAWRVLKEPVQSDANWLKVLGASVASRAGGSPWSTPAPQIPLDVLARLQGAVDTVKVGKDVLKNVRDLDKKARKEGITMNLRLAEQGMALAMARAVLNGRQTVIKDDLQVFADVLPQQPDDISKAYELCADFAGDTSKEANKLRKTFEPHANDLARIKDELAKEGLTRDRSAQLIDIATALKPVASSIEAKINDAKAAQADAGPLEALMAEILGAQDYIRKEALGL